MKKIAVILLIIMSLGIFAGCGGSSDGSTGGNDVNKTEGEICAELIPDPNEFFKEADITTHLDGRCYYYVTDYQDGEYDAYIEAIKNDGGFPIIHYEDSDNTGKCFWAYDKDKKYYLSVTWSYDHEGITIECHATEDDDDTEETDANEQ